MLFTTYQGAPLALILAFPNWDKEPKVELTLPTNIDRAISALESRRVFSGSARYSIDYTAYLGSADEAQRFRLFLTRLKGELLACPMWTDQCLLSAPCNAGAVSLQIDSNWPPARYGAEWILINEDASQWEIVSGSLSGSTFNLQPSTSTANAWPAETFIYPLIFGRLSERPKPQWITDETALAEIKIQENSGFTHKLNPSPSTINLVGSSVPTLGILPLWSIYPKFESPKDSTESDILYKSIGYSREDSKYVYLQGNRRTLELPFFRSGRAEIAAAEAFFVDRRGETRPFMIPTFRGDMRLTADLPQGDPRLIPIEEFGKPGAFEDGNRPVNPGDPFIALVTFDLSDLSAPPTVEPAKLSSIDAAGLHALNAIAQSHPMNATLVSHLLLARFNDTKLSWTYKTDGLATCTIKFLELANEYQLAPTDLPQPLFLYRFTHQLATPQYYLFTSYENQMVIPSGGAFAGTYLPAPFDHETLKTSVKLDDEKIEVPSFYFAGNPLMLMLPFQLEAKLWLEILEADAADLSLPPTVLFTGEIWDVDAIGQELKSGCLIFGRHMDKNFPNVNVQKVCNYAVYSPAPRCGADKAAFANTGALIIVNPTTINISAGAAMSDAVLAMISIGFIETGVGPKFERRPVVNATRLPANAGLQLTIKFPFRFAITGQSGSVYPGCDGTKETCKNIFNNYSAQSGATRGGFGGFPFTPDVNPTIKAMQAKTGTGKKG